MPHSLSHRWPWIVALGAGLLVARPISAAEFSAPLRDWALPLFTRDSFHSMTASGSEAHATGPHQFSVTDLNLYVFTGDATGKIETVILSPAAQFDATAQTAQGEKSVRFTRDDVDAAGTRWRYWHAQKKISLDGAVHVKFSAELPDLLK